MMDEERINRLEQRVTALETLVRDLASMRVSGEAGKQAGEVPASRRKAAPPKSGRSLSSGWSCSCWPTCTIVRGAMQGPAFGEIWSDPTSLRSERSRSQLPGL
jgi:hypothetical protein